MTTEVLAEAPIHPPEVSRPPQQKSHRKSWVVGAGALVGVCWWVGWHSPLTSVDQVAVNAPKGISAVDVRAASGITAGQHVLGVNGDAVRVAVMTAMPEVADVVVQRRLPHTIGLQVTVREPFAVLVVDGGYMMIDRDGVPFARVSKPKGRPIIEANTDAGRMAARDVLESLPKKVLAKVSRITATTRDNVTLVMRDAATVRWGSSEDGALKATVLRALLSVKATQYDVSAPMLPTTSGNVPTDSGTATP